MSNEELLEQHHRLMMLYIKARDPVKAYIEGKNVGHYARIIQEGRT